MDVGTTVYFLWYDFFLECERMMHGVVEDNSLWADHPRNSQLVNVRFHMPGVHGTVCHHFPASRLCTDSVRALQECPHDDCYLVCTNHKATVPDGSPSGITPSDAWQRVQQFKQEHWDEAHGHLATDYLDEYYQMWRDAIAAKHGYQEPAKQQKKSKCQQCPYWMLSETLGSPDKPVWHCRDGFSPSSTCQEEAIYNDECMEKYPAQRPAGWKPLLKPTKRKKKKRETNVIQLSLF